MQKKTATVHLLILDPSQNDAESMVSLLRNSGKATRAHRITSEEDLEDALKNSNWDLFLARDLEQEFGPDDALATIKRMDKDIPFVLLTEAYDRDRTANILRADRKSTRLNSSHVRISYAVFCLKKKKKKKYAAFKP